MHLTKVDVPDPKSISDMSPKSPPSEVPPMPGPSTSTPDHMAPKRSKWISPPPPSASAEDRSQLENQLGLGLALATLPTDARQTKGGYASSSNNSEILPSNTLLTSNIHTKCSDSSATVSSSIREQRHTDQGAVCRTLQVLLGPHDPELTSGVLQPLSTPPRFHPDFAAAERRVGHTWAHLVLPPLGSPASRSHSST